MPHALRTWFWFAPLLWASWTPAAFAAIAVVFEAQLLRSWARAFGLLSRASTLQGCFYFELWRSPSHLGPSALNIFRPAPACRTSWRTYWLLSHHSSFRDIRWLNRRTIPTLSRWATCPPRKWDTPIAQAVIRREYSELEGHFSDSLKWNSHCCQQ